MTFGLTFMNTSGTVQIDETWQNYGLVQKIPVTVTAYNTSPPNPAGYNGMPVGLTVSGTQSLLVACRAEVLQPCMLHSYYSGGTWTFNWVFVIPGAIAVTETVQFYIFDVLDGSSFGSLGVKVLRGDGSLVFHSDALPMRLSGVLGCDTAFNGTPGRSYVPLIMRSSAHGISAGGGSRLAFHTLRVSGSSIITSLTGPGAFGATGVYPNPGAYAALDVTNY